MNGLTLPFKDLAALCKDEVTPLVCGILWSVGRPGVDRLVMALGHDRAFFDSPASVRHHSSFPGRLAHHSLLIYRLLWEKNELYGIGLPDDTVSLTAVCHGLCKAGTVTPVHTLLLSRRKAPRYLLKRRTLALIRGIAHIDL